MCRRKNSNRHISEDEYVNRYIRQTIPYEGFVTGKGYAFFRYDTICPATCNISGKMFWDRYTPTVCIQSIDASDYMKERSCNVTPEDISKRLVRINPDGTMTVSLGINNEITLSKEHGKCEIRIDDTGSEVNVHVSVTDSKYEDGVKIEQLAFSTSCRLKDFHTFFDVVSPYSINGMDLLETGTGVLDMMQGATETWWNNLSKQKQNKYIYDARKYIQNAHGIRIKPRVQDIRRMIPKKLNVAGRAIGGVGLGISVYSAIQDKKVTVGESLDIVMGTVSFIPVYGWIIGGIYFIGDIVVEEVTGHSIGDLIDNQMGEDAEILDINPLWDKVLDGITIIF